MNSLSGNDIKINMKINTSSILEAEIEEELIFNNWIEILMGCESISSVATPCSIGDNTQFQILQIQFIAKQSGKYSPILKRILSTTDYSIAQKIPIFISSNTDITNHKKDSIENLSLMLDEKFVYM